MYFAVIQDKSSFITFVSAIKGSQKRIASVVLEKCNLCRKIEYDWEKIAEAAFHDKKADGGKVTVTTVNDIGSFEMKTMDCRDVIELAKDALEGF